MAHRQVPVLSTLSFAGGSTRMGTHYWSQNKKFATSQSVNEQVKSAAQQP
jgi:hypothetical protein